MKKTFTIISLTVFLILGLKTDPSLAACSTSYGCNYTSTASFCANGSCGPGYCEGVSEGVGCDAQCNCSFSSLNCYSCAPPCTPNCTGKVCGQSNGCGGTCPNTGATTWTAWNCGTCEYRGGCGNINWYQDCTRSNLCGQTENMTQACFSECHECGARISDWSAWSACTVPGFNRSRTRSCGEDCGTNDCANVALTDWETCVGTIYGTFFDASTVDTCATFASQNKVEGAAVSIVGVANGAGTYNSTTNAGGAYASNVLIPEVYNISYTLPTTVRYIASPPKLLCDGALTGISLTGQGEVAQRRVGLWRIYGGWFQVQGGGAYGNTGITVTIPATCILAANQTTCNSYTSGTVRTPLIVADANGNVGSAYAGTGSVSLGGGGTAAANAIVSSKNYQAVSNYADRPQGYEFFMKQGSQYQNTSKTAWAGTGKPSGASNNLYKTNITGTLTLGTANQPGAGESYVIFHDGDVSITSDIDVPVGSFIGVVATGSIRVQAGVGRVEGVYIADQNFEVLSSGDENTEVRFIGEGSFVGLTGISLLRTRGLTNNSQSTEFFIFRPDFVVNTPYGLRLPQYTWREVAP